MNVTSPGSKHHDVDVVPAETDETPMGDSIADAQPAETDAEDPDAPEAINAETYAGWVELVERIRSGEAGSLEELYQLFSKGIRFYLCRQLGPQELDDKVHDTFVVVVQAIQRGELREPQRLMGFVRTIVRRQVAAHTIGSCTLERNRLNSILVSVWQIRERIRRPTPSSIRTLS